jgi:hypothetical protein
MVLSVGKGNPAELSNKTSLTQKNRLMAVFSVR